jgi:hypothetical protein
MWHISAEQQYKTWWTVALQIAGDTAKLFILPRLLQYQGKWIQGEKTSEKIYVDLTTESLLARVSSSDGDRTHVLLIRRQTLEPKSQQGRYYTDKKENQIFLTYKEIQNGAVAKSYMTNGPASSYMGKYLHISSYIRKPFLMHDFATAPLWISYIWGKFDFLFYQCSQKSRQVWHTPDFWGSGKLRYKGRERNCLRHHLTKQMFHAKIYQRFSWRLQQRKRA